MKRWTHKLETLRQQAQLAGAFLDPRPFRKRSAPPAPPSHVAEPQAEEPTPAATARPTPATVQRKQRPGRKQGQAPHEQDELGTLLQTDVRSQQLAEKLWWKWARIYLPAKQRELATRRGAPAVDEEERAA